MERPLVDLKGKSPEELEAFIASLGKQRFRTKQIVKWMYGRGVNSFGEMTDLSRAFREDLGKIAYVSSLKEISRAEASDGTVKFLFQLEDGERVESVLIFEGRRRTVCVSSQVGCPLGCAFCATGQMGFVRDLTAGEIVDQLICARRVCWEQGENVTNVVLMGMGEPLLNYENVLKAVRLMGLEEGISLGARKITLSTAGILPQVMRLADEGLKVGLAISLNATTDALRSRLMPVNRRYPISGLMNAARAFARKTRRRVTIEYVLIEGLNDSAADAERLVELVHGMPCKINLIGVNPNAGSPYQPPMAETIEQFREILVSHYLTAFVRGSKGSDIAAACGQLRTGTTRL
jgi:23S rRNA (adenine2503-C2)-methyltransferase